MSKILFNPDNGAPIQDVNVNGTKYFSEKIFEPGSLFKFEDDDTANWFLDTFGFLEEISLDKAQKILKEPVLTCEKCNFTTRIQATMTTHEKKHAKEAQLDELGIPVVRATQAQKIVAEMVHTDIQKDIDNEGKSFGDGYPGLTEGDGLTRENVSQGAIMSGN